MQPPTFSSSPCNSNYKQGLTGVRNIADDIFVYGKTLKEHDINLDKCLQPLLDRGLRLNQEKCSFLSRTLKFFGQIFSVNGTQLDPAREKSTIGMGNYSARYILEQLQRTKMYKLKYV